MEVTDAAGDETAHGAVRTPVPFVLALGSGGELVKRDGSMVTIRNRKSAALLALLALHPGGLSRQRAIGLLWPDRGDAQARASLRQALYELRALFGAETLPLSGDRITIDRDAIRSDVADAEAAAARQDGAALLAALAPMQLPMLSGLDGISEELDDWLRSERPMLATRMATLAREAIDQQTIEADPDLARKLADQALRLDPFDERSLRCAMRIDAALGDQARLHRRFRAFAAALDREMQAKPARDTQALFDRLRTISDAPAEPDRGRTAPQPLAKVAHPPTVVTAKLWPRLVRWPMIAVVIFVAAIVAATGYRLLDSTEPSPTIAVVPFTTLSGSQYVATGVADELEDRLAHQPGVRVIGRFTAKQLQTDPDPLAKARRLNVSHLLTGSVQAEGGRLRVIVQLTRVADGALLWSDRLDRPASDLFAVQNDIASAVTRHFTDRSNSIASPRQTPQPAVYDRYLAARSLIRDRRPVSLAAADRALREAIAQQPDYAPAHALLAQALMLEAEHPVSYGTLPLDRTRDEARRHAETAVRLDPALGEAQAALGLLTYSNASSLPYYRRAVALDPQRAEFHRWLGQSLMATGHSEEALAELRRAVEIDPLWGLSYEHLIIALDRTGHTDQILALVRQFLSLSNDDRAKAQLLLAQHSVDGRLADVLRMAKQLVDRAPGEHTLRFKYASALAPLGAIDAARVALGDDHSFGALVLAGRPADLATAARARPDLFWDIGSGFWDADDYLVANGYGAALLDTFDRRFGSVDRFRVGEILDPSEAVPLIVALRQNGRRAEADRLLERLRRDVRHADAHAKPMIVLADQAMLDAFAGNRDRAFAALDKVSRDAPALLVSIPYKPLSRRVMFAPLGDDARLTVIDRRVRVFVNGQRRQLGWAPLTDKYPSI